jgi:hypothetical protein
MGNPMPGSTLFLCQSRLHPPVRVFEFGLSFVSPFIRITVIKGEILKRKFSYIFYFGLFFSPRLRRPLRGFGSLWLNWLRFHTDSDQKHWIEGLLYSAWGGAGGPWPVPTLHWEGSRDLELGVYFHLYAVLRIRVCVNSDADLAF